MIIFNLIGGLEGGIFIKYPEPRTFATYSYRYPMRMLKVIGHD
jgi:hypothetical protein